jgi:CoA:oxalate CoA-transferase
LAEQSDVVVENFRPGVMERLGLGYGELSARNPRIVMASLSGYGQPAEGNMYWRRPAFNMVMQAMAGITEVTGYEDRRPAEIALPIGDLIPGMMTALAIVEALYKRERTGQGEYIDLSMYDALSLVSERSLLNYQLTGELPKRGEEKHIAPHSSYLAKDGYFVVDCYSTREWNALCKVVGRSDLVDHEDFDSGSKRAERAETHIRPMLEDWAADKTKKEAADLLAEAGVGAAPVQNVRDMLECPHLAHREMLVRVEDPVAGELVYPGDPIKLSQADHLPFEPAPLLGEHNHLLQEMLDLTGERMEELRRGGVI